jgi:Sulfotransferase domain
MRGPITDRRRYRSVVADSARWDGFRFRDGDIVISTPPKCGTTWMQRLVALVVFDGPELPAPISKVSPWLDMQLAPLDDVTALLEAQTHRRFIKTHTPLDGIPYDLRVRYICVGRDPRDVAVSARHHMSNMNVERFMASRKAAVGLDDLPELGIDRPGPPPPQSDADALRAWMDDDSGTAPMTLRFVLTHLSTFWSARQSPNIALFHYGDLSADLTGELRRLASFLGYDISAERATELAQWASFDAMKRDAATVAPNADIALWHNTEEFFHKGQSGQWRAVFTGDHLERYTERVRQLVPSDLADWLHQGNWAQPQLAR